MLKEVVRTNELKGRRGRLPSKYFTNNVNQTKTDIQS